MSRILRKLLLGRPRIVRVGGVTGFAVWNGEVVSDGGVEVGLE